MRYKVVIDEDGCYSVVGLKSERHDMDEMLLFRYEEGDCDHPQTVDQMHSCLYDLYQCNEQLKEGDEFETPFGNFVCKSVHVIPLVEPT